MTNKKKKTTAAKSNLNKRKSVRFAPDPGTIAGVDLEDSADATFRPKLFCLVAEESFKGCGLVSMIDKGLQVGEACRVQIGNGPVLRAEVRWRSDLDSQVMRLGLMYLED